MTTPIDCQELEQLIRELLNSRLSVRSSDDGVCAVRLPFDDAFGDPISITVRPTRREDLFVVDDGGAIAAQMFTLGQQAEDTPSSKLLRSISEASNYALNYDYGTVEAETTRDGIAEVVVQMGQIVQTLLRSMPHIRSRSYRMRTLGPRLRTRIKNAYDEASILSLVEPGYQLTGAVVEAWHIDFRWQVTRPSGSDHQDIFVIAIDLDVNDPLRKVERISSLVVDTKSRLIDNELRVVMDRQGRDSDATIAAQFLMQHSQDLGFTLFDFDNAVQRQDFVRQSADELLGDYGSAWRELITGIAPR